MKLSPPKAVTWWICCILCILTIMLALQIIAIPSLPSAWVFWMPVAGLIIMLLATLFPGL